MENSTGYPLGRIFENLKKLATSGNRTRASRVAGENSTTEPTLLEEATSRNKYEIN